MPGSARIDEAEAPAGDTREPRLLSRSIRVHMHDGEESSRAAAGSDAFALLFRLEAILSVDPIQERIAFDASVDFSSSSVVLSERT